MVIPFNRPYMTGKELGYIAKAHHNGMLAGDGPFTKLCHEFMQNTFGIRRALLTHSCTAALEMTALLLDLKVGDEVIMPSYTFVSTANAFVLRGAVPVFVDVRSDTLNIDESLIEAAITNRTRAIVVVHYAGVACEMDTILQIAAKHNLMVIEDAAQGFMSSYKNKPLGRIGTLGTYSFHETKNIISGEGGALLINDPRYEQMAEIIREKGTNRSQFFRGEVDKYTWQLIGSSYLPGEIIAAFLWAQMEEAKRITLQRKEIWQQYHTLLEPLEAEGILARPVIPADCQHNGHIYYVILRENIDRQRVLTALKEQGIYAVFHYVPLHSSPGGMKFGRASGTLPVTSDLSERLIRLPLWIGLEEAQVEKIVRALKNIIHEFQ